MTHFMTLKCLQMMASDVEHLLMITVEVAVQGQKYNRKYGAAYWPVKEDIKMCHSEGFSTVSEIS